MVEGIFGSGLRRMLERRRRARADTDGIIGEAFGRIRTYLREVERSDAARRLTPTRECCATAPPSPVIAECPGHSELGYPRRERLEEVAQALCAVDEQMYAIFVAHRAGHTYQEIAAELQIPLATVEQQIARVMLFLMTRECHT